MTGKLRIVSGTELASPSAGRSIGFPIAFDATRSNGGAPEIAGLNAKQAVARLNEQALFTFLPRLRRLEKAPIGNGMLETAQEGFARHLSRPLNATFSTIRLTPGRIAMSSQSGALGLAVLAAADQYGLGFSSFVSVGNKADVSGNDLLQYWEDDPRTGLILLYLESFGNPRRFAPLARRIARKKPILAVKSGRSVAGRRAALRLFQLVISNDAWASNDDQHNEPRTIVHALLRLTRVARPGSMIFLLSDFSHIDDEAERYVRQLAARSDLFLVHIFDPIEKELPPPGRYRIQFGRRTVTIETGNESVRQRYRQQFDERCERLQSLSKMPGVTLLRCATNDDPLHQIACFGQWHLPSPSPLQRTR